MGERIVIIPARHGSVRFPGKPLANETGRPLIQHVVESARRCAAVARVVVATDDARIEEAVRGFGGECVMTRADHENGTSRLAEAAEALGLGDDAVVVNVQGDEPEIEGEVSEGAIEALEAPGAVMGTVGSMFAADEDPADANIVKVVRRLDGTALYFSRALIPHLREGVGEGEGERALKHVGIYAYRRDFLRTYVGLSPTPLERTERLEQLRALEHGFAIGVEVRRAAHHGIDTPQQYAAFVERWRARMG
ncbi:MAG: 3-deoxy-manno-octulosonate cytidylyltransferase [Planctomycetota bacterium]|nr:3-deoxy-manno-octulosonate cytidylyltransferase [Planctomycetota bacterium]